MYSVKGEEKEDTTGGDTIVRVIAEYEKMLYLYFTLLS